MKNVFIKISPSSLGAARWSFNLLITWGQNTRGFHQNNHAKWMAPPPRSLLVNINYSFVATAWTHIYILYECLRRSACPFHWVRVFVALWLVDFSRAVTFLFYFWHDPRHQSRSHRRGYISRRHFRTSIAKRSQYQVLLQIHRWRLGHFSSTCRFITGSRRQSALLLYEHRRERSSPQ